VNEATPILEELTPTIKYSFQAQSVAHDAMQIVGPLQVPTALLFEGSPGVGKTVPLRLQLISQENSRNGSIYPITPIYSISL
jgi:midasin (ATPase involved in ribosome maturation)